MLAILADPVAHVKAPSFVNPVFAEIGRDWFVAPMHVKPDDLEEVVRALQKVNNYLGVILTIPHKEAMARLCDELGTNARLTGTVNAVRFSGSRLVGEMFDGVGLVMAQQKEGIAIAGRRVLLLGAGGAARAVAFAFCQEGVAALRISNRSQERAERLVADIHATMPDADVAVAGADLAGYDLVVNCTALGLYPNDPMPADPQRLAPTTDVVDIIAARDTEFMAAAEARGCRVIGGLPMAVGQVAAFSEFFDPANKT
jgi:shikimate dehydrogenase